MLAKWCLKFSKPGFQQYVNPELPDVQAGFRKGRGTKDQIANICQIIKKARELQKNIYFCFIDYAKGFDCVDHNQLWKIVKEMEIPDHLTCLLRNLYARQEATARTGHGTTDWFQIGKVVRQGCILSASFEKTLMLGKIEGRRRRGWQRMRWLDGITGSMDIDLINSRSWRWTGRPGVLWFMGSQKVRHGQVIELTYWWLSNFLD